jgi:hypothetical protein
MPNYKATAQTTPAEQGMCVTNQDNNDQTGPRLVFQSVPGWIHIPRAAILDFADQTKPGIYTTGQFNCIAIIVAKFGGLVRLWSEAWLAHVGNARHSLVDQIVGYADQQSHVAIGGKWAVRQGMKTIRDRFEAEKHCRVWVYQGVDATSSFGMNRAGYFGEAP